MPDPKERLLNLGDLSPNARARLSGQARDLVADLIEAADKMAAQDLLEKIWDFCSHTEPNVGTMALMLAGFTSRTLVMFAEQGVPIPVMVPALSLLTAMITDQQMEADRERGGVEKFDSGTTRQ